MAHRLVSSVVFGLVSLISVSAFAEEPKKAEGKGTTTTTSATVSAKTDKDKETKTGDEMPAERAALSVAGTPMLPVGDLSNGFAFALGATLGFDYAVHPHVQVIGRTGYIHHLPKSGLDVTLGAVPIWGGARYTFGVNEGGYLEGALGPTVLFASARVNTGFGTASASDTEVKIGTALGGGYKIGRLDVGGRMVFWDLGHAGSSAGVMATIGYSFLTF